MYVTYSMQHTVCYYTLRETWYRGDFPESLYEDLLKNQEEVINPIPATQTTLFNEIIMRWQNNAIKWDDFACENSNQLGKRFRRRSGETICFYYT